MGLRPPRSTTGQSHDNSVCSPYSITWHVDKDCHQVGILLERRRLLEGQLAASLVSTDCFAGQVSPESFDNLCKQMKETYNMEARRTKVSSLMELAPKKHEHRYCSCLISTVEALAGL